MTLERYKFEDNVVLFGKKKTKKINELKKLKVLSMIH